MNQCLYGNNNFIRINLRLVFTLHFSFASVMIGAKQYIRSLDLEISCYNHHTQSVANVLTLRKILVTPNVTVILTLTSANFHVLDFAFSSLYAVV